MSSSELIFFIYTLHFILKTLDLNYYRNLSSLENDVSLINTHSLAGDLKVLFVSHVGQSQLQKLSMFVMCNQI